MSQIYNGTFVLGNTSACTISAGPGIKLDTSVPGVIGIGTDETVLWSGEQNVIGNTTATLNLSEVATNFEKLRIYVYGSAQVGAITPIDIVIISDTGAYYTLSVAYTNNTTNTLFVDCCVLQIDGTSFSVSKGFRKSITTGVSNDTSRGPTIVKVIGINRISGGN